MSSSESESRYSWGADEHLVVMLSEAMSLRANFLAMAMANDLDSQNIEGLVDICPSNASLLVRFDPDIIPPPDVESIVRESEDRLRVGGSHRLDTRIFELPVWYDDPYTKETQMRFRDYHQTPSGTDLTFAASENNMPDAQAFIDAHSGSPWITSMVGFVAGLPFLFQMVPQERQLEVPKYVRPRTDTPKQTIGFGGCFTAIYSVRGAGGYQMFGITPVPIFDPKQRLPDFKDFMIFFRPGDIVKFRAVDEAEYREIEKAVEDGTYTYRQTPVTFELEAFEADPDAYNAKLLEVLYGN